MASAEQARLRRMTMDLPLGRDPASVRRRVEALEQVLERVFTVPGINQKVGVDAIAGLVPIAGNLMTTGMSLYLVWEARNLGLSKWQVGRMLCHVGVDTVLGAVPIIGNVFDFFYRSNSRNLKIIRKHLDRKHPASRIVEG